MGKKNLKNSGEVFIDRDKLFDLSHKSPPSSSEVDAILNRALRLKGLSLEDTALLLQIEDPAELQKLLHTAREIKELIYGKRLVLFAPLYIGNKCSNNCLYCGFRRDNKALARAVLTQEQIHSEVVSLLKEGHKRVLMLCGESVENPLDYFVEAIDTAYSASDGKSSIRRINVEIAPMETKGFARLKASKIGTYICFQETYDPVLYKEYHPSGPKADYAYRLTVMDRAMEGGIDDVGIGALFGLGDYKFEVLGLMEHAFHLEKVFGCGPHTVSIPRLMPAEGSAISSHVPYPVSDEDFKKLVAVIRVALPYTGIILSTRESEAIRTELFHYGISQISAGSRTNPGAYSHEQVHQNEHSDQKEAGSQFSLGDHRNLDEVISDLIDEEYIPSFCTGCYRKGRVGHDFMDLAKPGLIKEFCMPNGAFTFKEYLLDYASQATREKGLKLIDKIVNELDQKALKEKMTKVLSEIEKGKRDIYF
jgi:2-iminoacetate synthase